MTASIARACMSVHNLILCNWWRSITSALGSFFQITSFRTKVDISGHFRVVLDAALRASGFIRIL
jgi:hypothetical protein